MLCEWDLAQMQARSLGLKFFNVQLMHKIHSLSLPRLASLELSRWEYFYMTVPSWVNWLPGLSPHNSVGGRCPPYLCLQYHQTRIITTLGHPAGSSYLGPLQWYSLEQGQYPVPPESSSIHATTAYPSAPGPV